MSSELTQQLDRSLHVEQIAELLYEAHRATSVLFWDEVPHATREEYRARARESVRSCLDYAVEAGRAVMAHALCSADGQYWDDLSPVDQARYRHRAFAAWSRYRWHMAESAYPEAVERDLGSTASLHEGRTLGELAQETRQRARVVGIGGDWRNEFAKERQ
jgi:hypothetical protein